MLPRLWRWLTDDPVLARLATEAYIRQEFEKHPADRGEHWRVKPIREIKETSSRQIRIAR